MNYQGWSNAQTWCVALTLNNPEKLQREAFSIARDYDVEAAAFVLWLMANRHRGTIEAMAAWAWEDKSLRFDVNWREIAEEMKDKVAEGA